jgi:hypothetical protein
MTVTELRDPLIVTDRLIAEESTAKFGRCVSSDCRWRRDRVWKDRWLVRSSAVVLFIAVLIAVVVF